ncbi:HPr family phosphocarrier protein [Dongshaea marina]|uniref:HPr family phosphocarrier protein n=1 Tax=Dongshaea marina TaxID=2047966 RepID=UPI000D3E0C0A|nr:HPr family phosphocarrier protein [Dongshaea marina]
MKKVSTRAIIRNRLGLHARAAIKLVELCDQFDAKITLSNDQQCVEANTVMGLLMLELAQGQTLKITVKGPDADQALEAIKALVESGFEEPE